jgi:hypothetical protein
VIAAHVIARSGMPFVADVVKLEERRAGKIEL